METHNTGQEASLKASNWSVREATESDEDSASPQISPKERPGGPSRRATNIQPTYVTDESQSEDAGGNQFDIDSEANSGADNSTFNRFPSPGARGRPGPKGGTEVIICLLCPETFLLTKL
ncbi:hypothetical protein LX36DRAFT_384509 [Colletotrichum falcatum]|nr:hypothetical protein LX36DRAFT_384509 [Colletotrichum falcatum]